jgi:hypothetical protein
MDGIPTDLLGRERYRIGFGDEVSIAHVDYCCVLSNARTDDDARIRDGVLSQKFAKQFGR